MIQQFSRKKVLELSNFYFAKNTNRFAMNCLVERWEFNYIKFGLSNNVSVMIQELRPSFKY